VTAPAENQHGRASGPHRHEDVLWSEDDTLGHDYPRLPRNCESAEADAIGRALMRGRHLSFPDYHRNYLNQ
jgi:hypothetical protein